MRKLIAAAISAAVFVVPGVASAFTSTTSVTPSTTKGPKKAVSVSKGKVATIKFSTDIQAAPDSGDASSALNLKSVVVKIPGFAVDTDAVSTCDATTAEAGGCDDTAAFGKSTELSVTATPLLPSAITGTLTLYYAGGTNLTVLLDIPSFNLKKAGTGTFTTGKSGTTVTIDLSAALNYIKTLTGGSTASLPAGLSLGIKAAAKFGLNDSLVVTQCPKSGWKFSASLIDTSGAASGTPYTKTVKCKQTK